MPINQHVPVGPPLGHPHHGFINGTVTVWMVFTHNVTRDTGRFLMGFIRCDSQLIHSIQNPTVYWFETITNIWKRP